MPDSRPDTELSNPQSAKAPLDPHLKALENESIHIFREVAAEFERPVMTNDKGAQLELSGKQVGLQVNADLSGIAITVK